MLHPSSTSPLIRALRGGLRRSVAMVCLALYLPAMFGGGECVELCIGEDGALSIDYAHRCGRMGAPEDTMHTDGGQFHHDGDDCTDIPLSNGSMIHVAAESDDDLGGHLALAVTACTHDILPAALPAPRIDTASTPGAFVIAASPGISLGTILLL